MRRIILEKQYYEPFVSDCFTNNLASILLQSGFDPDTILCDYYSFVYNSESHIIGINYPLEFNKPVYLDQSYGNFLNAAYKYLRFFPPVQEGGYSVSKETELIGVYRYTSDCPEFAWNRLKHLIDNGIPGLCAVDVYHMPYHRYYGQKHAIHYVTITGYDEVQGEVELFDRYKTIGSDFEGTVPLHEFIKARSSENPLDIDYESISGVPIRNLWVEVDIPESFHTDSAGLQDIIRQSINKMNTTGEWNGFSYGTAGMDRFIDDMRKVADWGTDLRYYFIYCLRSAFKNLQRHRTRFDYFIKKVCITGNEVLLKGVGEKLHESSGEWQVLSNLAFKYGMKQSDTALESIIGHLKKIRETEAELSVLLAQLI